MVYFHVNSVHHTPADSIAEIKSVGDPNTPNFFNFIAIVLTTGSDPDEPLYHWPGSEDYKSWNSVVVAGVKLFPHRHSRAELDAVLTYLVQKVELRDSWRECTVS